MKKNLWLILGIITLLVIVAIAYIGANAIMASIFDFRSPLADNPPTPTVALGESLTDRVVIVLVDALREDTALNTNVMPYLSELRQQSAWATMHSIPPSYSAPSWTTLLTGAQPDINDGQAANPPDQDSVRAFTQDDIFAAAQRAGLQTAVSGYSWLEGMLLNSGIDAGFYTEGEDNAADEDVLAAFLPWIKSNEYQLTLIHLDQIDWAGHHEGGPQDPNWDLAATRVDAMIEEIAQNLDFESDTLIVISDHGQIDQGGHGGQDPIVLVQPFVMVGPNVIQGNYPDINQVNIAPTVSALLGLNIPASSQGQVLTEMLNLSEEQITKIEYLTLSQQTALLAAYRNAVNPSFSDDSALQSLDEIEIAMQSIKNDRLNKERLPRAFVALVLALIPAIILFKKWGKETALLLGGSILYIIIFNIIYALIIGKTYSLSSVISPDDLIFSTATYSAISLVIAWLVTMFGIKAFSKTPSISTKLSLSLTFTTLYLLLLPFLWNFYRNGIVITWTLPEFSSMFLGFLSTVQGLFVAVAGLLLIGISTLVAKFSHKG